MKQIKKILIGLMLAAALSTSASCSSKGKYMDALKGKEGVFAVLTTEKGEIVLELFYKQAPLTVTNFVGLAEGTLDAAKGKPFYDGLKFHRVIADFMIQGGDPLGNGTGGPGYKFADEFVEGLIFDKPGKLAMANSGPNTNGSQFFITHVPTDWLNYKHTIFGEVVTGQDVVDAVAQNDTIKSLKIIRQGKEAEAFKATQADFNRLEVEAKKKAEEAKKAKLEAEKKAREEMTKNMTKSDSGVYYKVDEEGKGALVGKNKNVKVDYLTSFMDGRILDVSSGFHPQGHEPIEFKTGARQMIPGFDIMVQEMKVGESRTCVIPPELAYGKAGHPAGIPGDTWLLFQIKVLSAK